MTEGRRGTNLLAAFPLLALPVLFYNVAAAMLAEGGVNAPGGAERMAEASASVTMASGALWTISFGDMILITALVVLFVELLKSAAPRGTAIVNHGLSMLLFVICLVEFLLIEAFATSTFFLITLMVLMDVMAGFIVSIVAARRDFGFDFCRAESEKNPFVAGPLKRTDCSLVSDGAAALVIADTETALEMRRAIAFRATAHAQDFLPMSKRDILKFDGCAEAWRRALAQAGAQLSDLSFVETHDCFTIAELIEYEAMGLTPEGQGARAIKEGWTQKDGKLPVNPSGGLKAKGHPIGATGVSMHVMAAMQVRGDAGEMQVTGAKLGGVYNMGGACVASYVSVLEALR